MDSITQAALGAAIGEVVLGKKIGNKALILGAIVATIPDLDVLLIPFLDAFEKISVHRGFSHSILFCILGAFLIAYILTSIKWTKSVSYKSLWIFSFLALVTHVLLDTFTTYGTQLFLPFSDWRVGLDSINIVDPLYTVPLIIGVVGGIVYRKKLKNNPWIPNAVGLTISTVYLLFTLINKQQVENIFHSQLHQQHIESKELLTVPVKVGNVIWYGVAKDDTHLHIGKYSLWEKNKIEFHSFPINDQLLNKLDTHLADRMKWFAKGFYTVAEKDGKIRIYNMQCDMQGVRYFGDYKAPTAFYFEVTPNSDGSYELQTGMHPK